MKVKRREAWGSRAMSRWVLASSGMTLRRRWATVCPALVQTPVFVSEKVRRAPCSG